MAMYKLEHKAKTKTERQTEWQKRFREASVMCHEKVKSIPKGKKREAFGQCMHNALKGRH